LEIYNEEIFDLLAKVDVDQKKLRIFEDAARKGSVVVQGLEEVNLTDRSEVYKIMDQGNEKRRVAETMMNKASSRSHSV
jgi:kinesin family protein 11